MALACKYINLKIKKSKKITDGNLFLPHYLQCKRVPFKLKNGMLTLVTVMKSQQNSHESLSHYESKNDNQYIGYIKNDIGKTRLLTKNEIDVIITSVGDIIIVNSKYKGAFDEDWLWNFGMSYC